MLGMEEDNFDDGFDDDYNFDDYEYDAESDSWFSRKEYPEKATASGIDSMGKSNVGKTT